LGAKIIGYSLSPPTNPNLYDIINLQNNIQSIIADVRDINRLSKAIKTASPDIVFHLAAQPIVRESFNDPVLTYDTNVMGTVNLLESSRKVNCIGSIVNVTTDKVYENKEWQRGYREDENLCGFDPYSNSKSCSELVTYSYKETFFNETDSPAVSTARSGNVIGGGDFAKDRIIPDCIRAAAKNEKILVRNPQSIRPYQHVLDTLFGYLILAKMQYEDKSIADCYNFGPNENDCITTKELVELFCGMWGDDLSWESTQQYSPPEASFLKLDCTKAKTMLNWEPKIDIVTAVEYTVDLNKVWIEGMDVEECMDNQIGFIANKYSVK